MHIFDELKERGLVFQTTDEEALRKALAEGNVSFYSGYDPTADSLHLRRQFAEDPYTVGNTTIARRLGCKAGGKLLGVAYPRLIAYIACNRYGRTYPRRSRGLTRGGVESF